MAKHRDVIEITDLFCGAGGTSTAAYKAAKAAGHPTRLIAINHWNVAIATHKLNHKAADHFCEDIESVKPKEAVPSGRLDILVASPVCTDHSNAKGGKPRSEQKRADATMIYRWIDDLYIESLLIENVPEFRNWGPLGADGLPLKSKRGEYFRAFISRLEIIYRVEYKVLNCADYGDPTTRKRFFLLAHRPQHFAITWPTPSHASRKVLNAGKKQPALFRVNRNDLKPWRSARDHVIDWTLEGRSIFGRKKPLSINTIRRIVAGLRKYSGIQFVMATGGPAGQQVPRSVDEPVKTVMPNSRMNLVEADIEPFVLKTSHKGGNGQYVYNIDRPLSTVTGQEEQALVEARLRACLVTSGGPECAPSDIDEPVRTLLSKEHNGLAEAVLINMKGKSIGRSQCTANHQALVQSEFLFNMEHGSEIGGRYCYDLERPMTTICGKGQYGLVEGSGQFLIPVNHGSDGGRSRTHSIDDPMPAVTTFDAWAVIEPFLIQYFGERAGQKPRTRTVDDPLWTVTGQRTPLLIQPFITTYHGNHKGRNDGAGRGRSVDEPLPVQDTANRFGLVEADAFLVKSYTGSDAASLSEPLPTVCAEYEHLGLCQPYLIKFNGTGKANSVDEPIGTLTGHDRFGLVIPQLGAILDIRFRMLQPHELAAAMSFPKSYSFSGTRDEKVKQIGNAVPVRTAKALITALLRRPDRLLRKAA